MNKSEIPSGDNNGEQRAIAMGRRAFIGFGLSTIAGLGTYLGAEYIKASLRQPVMQQLVTQEQRRTHSQSMSSDTQNAITNRANAMLDTQPTYEGVQAAGLVGAGVAGFSIGILGAIAVGVGLGGTMEEIYKRDKS